MHEPSNFPLTSDKKQSHSFTHSSFTVFLVPPPFSTRDAFLHMFLSRNFFRPFIHKAAASSGGAVPAVPLPSLEKRIVFCCRQRRFPKSCDCRKCDHVRLLCCSRRECHALRLRNTVL